MIKEDKKKKISTLIKHITTLLLLISLTTQKKIPKYSPKISESGYIGVTSNPTSNKIFYWYFPSRDKNPDAPLLIYLNGGPGCSSIIDTAVTNGPFTLKKDGSLIKNPNSWNAKSHILYIEQPIGVGYSLGEPSKYPKSATEIRDLFYDFYTKWLEIPNFQKFKNHPLYLTGVSYAGHYIPQIANKFHEMKNPDIALKGIIIGNPWTNYAIQNPTALEYSMTEQKLTLMNSVKYSYLLPFQPQCFLGNKLACDTIFNTIAGPWDNWNYNPWDITQRKCEGKYLCYDFLYVHDFYNRDDVKQELGVSGFKEEYHLCNTDYMQLLYLDFHLDASRYLEPVLDSGVRMLIFYGDKDLTVNWVGGKRMVDGVQWNGQTGFRNAEFRQGRFGMEKEFGGVRFVVVKDAGHLAGFSQPEVVFGLVDEFLFGGDEMERVENE